MLRRGRAGLEPLDASNTFYELRMVKGQEPHADPRALMLLYASDLLFRLRWEIEPALKKGRTVVAAPYVESAMAFGVAAGLPKGGSRSCSASPPNRRPRFV